MPSIPIANSGGAEKKVIPQALSVRLLHTLGLSSRLNPISLPIQAGQSQKMTKHNTLFWFDEKQFRQQNEFQNG